MTVLIGDKKIRIRNPKLLTYDDYAKLTPPDSGKYELHNGKIIYMPAPTAYHQRISMKLSIKLGSYIFENQLGELLAAPIDVVFSTYDTLQPDLVFISNDNLGMIQQQIKGVPDLVIEIKSPSNSNTEMHYKKYVYESTGVQEYWYILPEKQTLTQYKNIDGDLIRVNVLSISDVLTTQLIRDFVLPLKDIF